MNSKLSVSAFHLVVGRVRLSVACGKQGAGHFIILPVNDAEDFTIDTPSFIDMVGTRFEMVARMGASKSDAVVLRTRMETGKVVPLHSHLDPKCFCVVAGSIEVFLVRELLNGIRSKQAEACS